MRLIRPIILIRPQIRPIRPIRSQIHKKIRQRDKLTHGTHRTVEKNDKVVKYHQSVVLHLRDL